MFIFGFLLFLSLDVVIIIAQWVQEVKPFLKIILFRQIAQIPGNCGRKVCAFCELTNFTGCGIMENSACLAADAPLKIKAKSHPFSEWPLLSKFVQ
jgi:hypothetical protein